MTQNRVRSHLVLGALAVVSVALLAVTPAVAEPPPPPDFIQFSIRNASKDMIVNFKLEFWQSKSNFTTLDPTATITKNFPNLAPGMTQPFPFSNTFGVAKIRCTAECPAGNQVTVEITASQGQFTPPPTPPQYKGFTEANPSGAQFPCELVVLPPGPGGTKNRLRLHACEDWGGGEWAMQEADAAFP